MKSVLFAISTLIWVGAMDIRLVKAFCLPGAYDETEQVCQNPLVYLIINERDRDYWFLRLITAQRKVEVMRLPVPPKQKELSGQLYSLVGHSFSVDEDAKLWEIQVYHGWHESTFYFARKMEWGAEPAQEPGSPPLRVLKELSWEGTAEYHCPWKCASLDAYNDVLFITNLFGKVLIYDTRSQALATLYPRNLLPHKWEDTAIADERVRYQPHNSPLTGLEEEYILYYYSQAGFFLYRRDPNFSEDYELVGCLTKPPEILEFPGQRDKWRFCDHDIIQWTGIFYTPPPFDLSLSPSLFYLKEGSVIGYDFRTGIFTNYYLSDKLLYYEDIKRKRILPDDIVLIREEPGAEFQTRDEYGLVSASYETTRDVLRVKLAVFPSPSAQIADPAFGFDLGKRKLVYLECSLQISFEVAIPQTKGHILDVSNPQLTECKEALTDEE